MEKETFEALKKGDQRAWATFFTEFDPLIESVVAWTKWHFATPR